MNTPKKRWYQTMMEILTHRRKGGDARPRPIETVIAETDAIPPADPAFNDRELALAKDDNPTLRALMNHAYAGLENELAEAFDSSLKPETRLSALDRAGGFKKFIEDIEGTRAGLQKLIKEREARNARREERK